MSEETDGAERGKILTDPQPQLGTCAECGLPKNVIAHHPWSDETEFMSGSTYHPFVDAAAPQARPAPPPCDHECGTDKLHVTCECVKCGATYPNREAQTTHVAGEAQGEADAQGWSRGFMKMVEQLQKAGIRSPEELYARMKLIDEARVDAGAHPAAATRKCGCPHGCDATPDDQGRCPVCWNHGNGCPIIWKQQTKGSYELAGAHPAPEQDAISHDEARTLVRIRVADDNAYLRLCQYIEQQRAAHPESRGAAPIWSLHCVCGSDFKPQCPDCNAIYDERATPPSSPGAPQMCPACGSTDPDDRRSAPYPYPSDNYCGHPFHSSSPGADTETK